MDSPVLSSTFQGPLSTLAPQKCPLQCSGASKSTHTRQMVLGRSSSASRFRVVSSSFQPFGPAFASTSPRPTFRSPHASPHASSPCRASTASCGVFRGRPRLGWLIVSIGQRFPVQASRKPRQTRDAEGVEKLLHLDATHLQACPDNRVRLHPSLGLVSLLIGHVGISSRSILSAHRLGGGDLGLSIDAGHLNLRLSL